MNVAKVEATQSAVFDLIVQLSSDLMGVTAVGAIVAGNLLDPSVSPMVTSGTVLKTLTSNPAAGLTIDSVAKTITIHVDATDTATWTGRYASLQVFVVPTAATRYLAAQALIEITPNIT